MHSEIVRAMIQKESYEFNTFATIHIGEFQTSTYREDWTWVESKWNIADWMTRGKHPTEIGENSRWHKGPDFLPQSECEWPIKTDCKSQSLPELTKFTMFTEKAKSAASISNCTDINRYSSYSKLMCVTARVSSVFSKSMKPSLRNALNIPNIESIKQAETLWIEKAQRGLKDQIKKGYCKKLIQ